MQEGDAMWKKKSKGGDLIAHTHIHTHTVVQRVCADEGYAGKS